MTALICVFALSACSDDDSDTDTDDSTTNTITGSVVGSWKYSRFSDTADGTGKVNNDITGDDAFTWIFKSDGTFEWPVTYSEGSEQIKESFTYEQNGSKIYILDGETQVYTFTIYSLSDNVMIIYSDGNALKEGYHTFRLIASSGD